MERDDIEEGSGRREINRSSTRLPSNPYPTKIVPKRIKKKIDRIEDVFGSTLIKASYIISHGHPDEDIRCAHHFIRQLFRPRFYVNMDVHQKICQSLKKSEDLIRQASQDIMEERWRIPGISAKEFPEIFEDQTNILYRHSIRSFDAIFFFIRWNTDVTGRVFKLPDRVEDVIRRSCDVMKGEWLSRKR